MLESRLVGIEWAGKRKGMVYCRYRCICGNEKVLMMQNVRTGKTRSCGCLRRELTVARSTTHGMTGTLAYSCWKNMKIRCNNPSHEAYPRYGGAGITVCDRWLHSFENFLTDMGMCPAGLNSIDRTNNSLGYFKENCSWSNPLRQSNF